MSNAGQLFLRAAPALPDDDTGDDLSNNEDYDELRKVRSEERGNDEAETKCGWNHEGREGPKLSAGAGDKRVAVEKHTGSVMFESN